MDDLSPSMKERLISLKRKMYAVKIRYLLNIFVLKPKRYVMSRNIDLETVRVNSTVPGPLSLHHPTRPSPGMLHEGKPVNFQRQSGSATLCFRAFGYYVTSDLVAAVKLGNFLSMHGRKPTDNLSKESITPTSSSRHGDN